MALTPARRALGVPLEAAVDEIHARYWVARSGPGALGRLVLERGLMLGLPGAILGSLLAFILVDWLRDEYLSRDVSSGAALESISPIIFNWSEWPGWKLQS